VNARALVPAAVAAAALALAVVAVTGSAAVAGAGAVPVVSANVSGWHGTVKPRAIYVGQGGSPFVDRLHWTHWNATSAWASGRLWMLENPYCTPTYQCPYTHRYVAVTLSRAVHHGAKLFYTRMKWAYHQRGVRRIQRWYFRTYPGATVPGWQR
jgi:hypothetical protein